MKNIEVLFTDETKAPIQNIDQIHSVKNKLYFLSSENEIENLKVENVGKIFNGNYQKDATIIYNHSEDSDFESIDSNIFMLDDYYLYKINNKNEVTQIDAPTLTGQPYFEFLELKSDGQKLYIDSEKSNEVLVVDKNLNLESRIKTPVEEFYSGNDFCCINNKDHFSFYKNGKLQNTRTLKNLNMNTSYDRFDILTDCERDLEDIDYEIELKKLNYPTGVTMGNNGIYVFMSQGKIYYPTSEGGLDLGGNWENGEDSIIKGTFNQKYSFIFSNEKVGIFNGSTKIGENQLRMDTSKIKSVTTDEDFIYLLTNENTIQRYKILE